MNVRVLIVAVAVIVSAGVGLRAARPPQVAQRLERTSPTVLKQVDPKYTREALVLKIEGSVGVEVVIDTDGTVASARVIRSLDPIYGLDEEALKAVKQWVFEPARYLSDRQPVAARVTLDVPFRIQRGPSDSEAEFRQGTVGPDLPNLAKAKPIRQPKPKYTSDAMRAKLEGIVTLDVVVGADGSVLRARIAQSLDRQFGLDAEAMKAIKLWRFEPAMLDGNAVSTVEHITLEFRLH